MIAEMERLILKADLTATVDTQTQPDLKRQSPSKLPLPRPSSLAMVRASGKSVNTAFRSSKSSDPVNIK
jgi:hypothetical protein